MGRRRMVWRGEALDVPVTAGVGFCELQYFLGCESPLGWVLHYLSLLQGSQEAHLSPFSFSSGNATQCHVLMPYFYHKTCIVLVSACLGTATPEKPACCPCFNPPGKVWADPTGLFIIHTPCHEGSWPSCMAWIGTGCSGLESASAFSPEA